MKYNIIKDFTNNYKRNRNKIYYPDGIISALTTIQTDSTIGKIGRAHV